MTPKKKQTMNFGKIAISAASLSFIYGQAYAQTVDAPAVNTVAGETYFSPTTTDSFADSSAYLQANGVFSASYNDYAALQGDFDSAVDQLNNAGGFGAGTVQALGSADSYQFWSEQKIANPVDPDIDRQWKVSQLAYNHNIETVQNFLGDVNIADGTNYDTYNFTGNSGEPIGNVDLNSSGSTIFGSIQDDVNAANTQGADVTGAIDYYSAGAASGLGGGSSTSDLQGGVIDPVVAANSVPAANLEPGTGYSTTDNADYDAAVVAKDAATVAYELGLADAFAGGATTVNDLAILAAAETGAQTAVSTETMDVYTNFSPLSDENKLEIISVVDNGAWNRDAINSAYGAIGTANTSIQANTDAINTIAPDQGNLPAGATGIYGIAWQDDQGAIHLGDNSLITNEVGGVQQLYAQDGALNPIDINITNGSNLDVDTNLNVDGATTLEQTTVDGLFTANAGSVLNGGATVNGGFTSNNGSTLNGGTTLNGGATVNGAFVANNGATIANGLAVTGGTTTDNLTVTNSASVANDLTVGDQLTVTGFTTLNGGAQVNNGLDVNGGLTVDGGAVINNGLTVNGGATINGGLTTDTLTATTVNATTVNAGTVNGTTGNFTTMNVTGTTTTGTLAVTNNASIGNSLTVANDATIGDQLTVNGFTQLNGGLDVVGNTQTDSLTVNGSATVGNDLTVADVLTVGNDAFINDDITIGGDSSVAGNSFVGGSQTVNGNSFVNGSEFVAGNSTVGGNVFVGGDVFVGGNPVGLQSQVTNLKFQNAALAGSISSNNQAIQQNTRGIAMTAALTTMTVMPGMENAIDFHASYFDGKAGFSVGYARRINENIQVDVSAATSDDFKEGVVRAGASYQW